MGGSIAILPPCLNHLTGINQADKDVLDSTFSTYSVIEALDVTSADTVSRPRLHQPHVTEVLAPTLHEQ